jgi:hypothetical protein
VARTVEISLNPGETSLKSRQTDPARGFSLSDPEEGRRLMRVFFGIKQPALRQAIIKIVMELSKLDTESSSLQRSTLH